MRSFLAVLVLTAPVGALAWTETPLHPSHASPQGQLSRPASRVSLNGQALELGLSDAIYLGLRDNRAIRSAYLDRIAQKFDLRVAEDRFTPKLTFSGSYLLLRNQSDAARQGTVSPTATLLTPYGTRVSLGWTYRHTQVGKAGLARNDGANISLIQPLLRGAGREIATAPIRLARLAEQTNRLKEGLQNPHALRC